MTEIVKAQQADLAGEYGDVFWSLSPVLTYVAGSEAHCRIYVANTTDEERQYMLMAELSREGEVIDQFPLKVDGLAWFTVGANNVVGLPGAVILNYTDCALTINLYERETNQITDSVSTALTSQGTANLPVLPGLPAVSTETPDIMSTMLIFMVLVMMTTMMTRAVK